MEGAKPRHTFDILPHQRRDPLFHLAGGLVGEGHGENFAWLGAPRIQQMRNTRREGFSLAGACAGEHQNRPVQSLHRLALGGIQTVEIAGIRCAERGRSRALHRQLREGGPGLAGCGGCGGLEGLVFIVTAHEEQDIEEPRQGKARSAIVLKMNAAPTGSGRLVRR